MHSQRSLLAQKRDWAKTGMALAMGALVATAFMNTPRSRGWHLLSGGALVGFSIWHHTLYNGRGWRA